MAFWMLTASKRLYWSKSYNCHRRRPLSHSTCSVTRTVISTTGTTSWTTSQTTLSFWLVPSLREPSPSSQTGNPHSPSMAATPPNHWGLISRLRSMLTRISSRVASKSLKTTSGSKTRVSVSFFRSWTPTVTINLIWQSLRGKSRRCTCHLTMTKWPRSSGKWTPITTAKSPTQSLSKCSLPLTRRRWSAKCRGSSCSRK